MTNRMLVAAVFLVGCAVGGATSHLAVPKASAQQASGLPQWEMKCADVSAMSIGGMVEVTSAAGNRLGAERWEPVGGADGMWCFKRPKM